jgi:hypothetical protein
MRGLKPSLRIEYFPQRVKPVLDLRRLRRGKSRAFSKQTRIAQAHSLAD